MSSSKPITPTMMIAIRSGRSYGEAVSFDVGHAEAAASISMGGYIPDAEYGSKFDQKICSIRFSRVTEGTWKQFAVKQGVADGCGFVSIEKDLISKTFEHEGVTSVSPPINVEIGIGPATYELLERSMRSAFQMHREPYLILNVTHQGLGHLSSPDQPDLSEKRVLVVVSFSTGYSARWIKEEEPELD